MEIKRLSTLNIFLSIFSAAFVTGVLSFICYLILIEDTTKNWTTYLFMFGLMLFTIQPIMHVFKSKRIFYDSENLILKGMRKTERIPLKHIKKLKLVMDKTSILGIEFWRYRIEFNHYFITKEDEYFWVLLGGDRHKEFAEYLEEINPNVTIEHWAANWE